MKKLLCVLLAMFLCAVPFSGCAAGVPAAPAGGTAANGPVIGYICKELSQQWFSALYAAMEREALALGAARVLAADMGTSGVNYLITLDDMISQGVDCLVVCPPDEYLGRATVEKCAEAGILLLAESTPLYDEDGRLLAPAIVPDDYACGLAMGRWLGEYANQEDIARENVGFLCMTVRSANRYTLRHEGAVDAFWQQAPDFPQKKIFYANYDGTVQSAYNAAAAAITGHPGVKRWLVFAPNDEGAQSACRVLAQNGLASSSIAVGVGGYVAREEFENGESCFAASYCLDADEAGRLVALAAMNWLETGQEPWRALANQGESHGMALYEGVLITPE